MLSRIVCAQRGLLVLLVLALNLTVLNLQQHFFDKHITKDIYERVFFAPPPATTAGREAPPAMRFSSAVQQQRRELLEWASDVASLQEVAAVQELRYWLETVSEPARITHQLEVESRKNTWRKVSIEGDSYVCTSGKVRYGDQEQGVWVEKNSSERGVCHTAHFSGNDPAPGKLKTCECLDGGAVCENGKPVRAELCPGIGDIPCRAGCYAQQGLPEVPVGTLPTPREDVCGDNRPYELLWSCDRVSSRRPARDDAPYSEAQEVLEIAATALCAKTSLSEQFDVFLDCEFLRNYERWTRNTSEWLYEAYVTYVAGHKDSRYEWQATNLVRSIHLFSTRPIVVVAFDAHFVPPLSWRSLPNVIVYKMRPTIPGVSFNFNKIRSMIGARAVVGIQLDTDQIIFAGMDQVFDGTRREITAHHPWPLLPVHWMSRDMYPGQPYHMYVFRAYNGSHTMRWSHAHPTWSYWALPFLCDMLLERMAAAREPGSEIPVWRLQQAVRHGVLDMLRSGRLAQTHRKAVHEVWMAEDEDMFNVALWRDGVKKAWCKFDLEPRLFVSHRQLEPKQYSDPQWYPDGLPLLFLSSHNTKDFAETDRLLALLEQCNSLRPQIHCPGTRQYPFCKPGSVLEREKRRPAKSYAAQVCCCLEPRWTQPVFWHGDWYSSLRAVPVKAPNGSGLPRNCVMP